jgi:hypothetical protein
MVTSTQPTRQGALRPLSLPWHAAFLEMLPLIRSSAQRSFRNWPRQARLDAVDEVCAHALVAFARLVELGKVELAYATPLTRLAVKQVCDGRQVGCRRRVRDVLSRYAQVKKGFQVECLDGFDETNHDWRDLLMADRRATPADTAAIRIDFAEWLRGLPRRHRQIALVLATRETTCSAARRFQVSPARISQIRRELEVAWRTFQREAPDSANAVVA